MEISLVLMRMIMRKKKRRKLKMEQPRERKKESKSQTTKNNKVNMLPWRTEWTSNYKTCKIKEMEEQWLRWTTNTQCQVKICRWVPFRGRKSTRSPTRKMEKEEVRIYLRRSLQSQRACGSKKERRIKSIVVVSKLPCPLLKLIIPT